jgi:acyl carrier protein
MEEDRCHERLTKVFRETFDDPSLQIKDHYTARNIPGWNSLMHINLVLAIEEEFEITFTTAEIAGFKCVGDAKKLILRHA